MQQPQNVSKVVNIQSQTAESGVLTPRGWCGGRGIQLLVVETSYVTNILGLDVL
jgi:hypothetical protein